SQPLRVSLSYRPTLLPQQGGDSPIPVTGVLLAEFPHPLEQPLLLARWLFGPIPVRRSQHLQKPARRTPATQLAGHHRPSGTPSLLRAYNFFSHTASSTRFAIFLETGYRYFYMDYVKTDLTYDAAQSNLFAGVGVKF
ncbi:MAG: hypothetical protein WCE49_06105, partial [Terrimicrobiaceae bacterium]